MGDVLGDADMLQRFAYGMNANGDRTSVVATGSAVTNGTETYAYDELDRLTSATYEDAGTVDYTYDANGNRLTQTSGAQVTTSTYDDADQLTSLSGAISLSYGYDEKRNCHVHHLRLQGTPAC